MTIAIADPGVRLPPGPRYTTPKQLLDFAFNRTRMLGDLQRRLLRPGRTRWLRLPLPTPRPTGSARASQRVKNPLYRSRRALRTGAELRTGIRQTCLNELLANEEHVQVEATWGDLPANDRGPVANPIAAGNLRIQATTARSRRG
ncbi:hypothetical protein SKPI104516_19510 [Skermania piniformis]